MGVPGTGPELYPVGDTPSNLGTQGRVDRVGARLILIRFRGLGFDPAGR